MVLGATFCCRSRTSWWFQWGANGFSLPGQIWSKLQLQILGSVLNPSCRIMLMSKIVRNVKADKNVLYLHGSYKKYRLGDFSRYFFKWLLWQFAYRSIGHSSKRYRNLGHWTKYVSNKAGSCLSCSCSHNSAARKCTERFGWNLKHVETSWLENLQS